MITLHVDPDCRACRRLREDMEELALAHEVIEQPGSTDDSPPSHSMIDDERLYRGHQAVADHIEQLVDLVRDWTWFQSDICYFEGTCT